MDILRQHADYTQALAICQKLQSLGHTAWLAGGCVRDAILGRIPKDLDVATSARPEEVELAFSKTVAVGKQFGVIRVIEGEHEIEVASFRKDGIYSDGRHPESIEFSSPKEDAARRDFTINAMFWDPIRGELHDFFGGEQDLGAKLIRCVGPASQRFDEDKLRMLRAVRFVSDLGFYVDPEIKTEISKRCTEIQQVSEERVFDELNKLMNGRFRAQSWALFYETGLLKAVFPEIPHLYSDPVYENLAWVYGMAKGLSGVSAWSLLFLIDTTERRRTPNIEDRLRRLANVSVACRKLKTSRDFEEKLKWIVQAESQLWIGLRDAEIRKTAANAESASLVETVEALSHLTQELPKGFESLMDLVRSGYELPESYLKGEDLLALGLKPGPLFGEILDEGFRLQLEGKLARREQALEWLRSRGQRLH